MTVGAGDRGGQDVTDLEIIRHPSVIHQHVAGLTVLANHPDRLWPRRVGGASEKRLVPAAVEHRPGVVAHAAVDGHVGPDSGNLLHRPDRVKRHRRPGHDAATRFCDDAAVQPGRPATLGDSRRPPLDGRRLLSFDVGDAEASAHGQLLEVIRRSQRSDGLGATSQ